MIDLRSDTVTRPSKAMRERIATAEVGDDVFGDDPTVRRLEERVAGLLGKEAALFFPSGTQSNQTAIKTLTSPGDEVIVEAGAHLYNYEGGAPGLISGVQFRPIPGERGVITREQVEDVFRPGDLHCPPTRLVCLENTHNRAGGTVFPLETMRAVSRFVRDRGAAVHLDGARLFNAAAASGVEVAAWAAEADTVSICLSKGLGAPVGSCLSGTQAVMERAKRFRKILGGGMRQSGILAAAGIHALEENVDRLPEDHANAKRLAEGLAGVPGFRCDPHAVETNIVLIEMSGETEGTSLDVVERLRGAGLLIVPFGIRTLRAVTHLDVSAGEIDKAVEIFRGCFAS